MVSKFMKGKQVYLFTFYSILNYTNFSQQIRFQKLVAKKEHNNTVKSEDQVDLITCNPRSTEHNQSEISYI